MAGPTASITYAWDGPLAAPSQGDVLYYDGARWAKLAAGTNGQFLKTQGAGANPTWATVSSTPALDDLSDVTITTPASAQVLRYSGSAWVNAVLDHGTDLGGLSDDDHTQYLLLAGRSGQTVTDRITWTPPASTSGSPTLWKLNGAAHTTLAASTEAVDVDLALNRTVQFATGAITTQRAVVVRAPTYGFVGASTITTGVTFEVNGAPALGTNATITNRIAARIVGATATDKVFVVRSTDGSTTKNAIELDSNGTTNFSVRADGYVFAAFHIQTNGDVWLGAGGGLSFGGNYAGGGIVRNQGTGAITWSTQALAAAGVTLVSGTATQVPWTIKGAASQSADFLQIQKSDATVYSSVGSLGELRAAVGTVSLPGVSFQGDTDSGLYWIGANDIGMAVNGTQIERWQNSSGTPKWSIFGVAPVARASAYTPTNVTTDRAYDANATTVDELADVLGTLISDLQAYGILQ